MKKKSSIKGATRNSILGLLNDSFMEASESKYVNSDYINMELTHIDSKALRQIKI